VAQVANRPAAQASADRGLAAELDPVRPLIDAAWLEELGLIGALYESEAAMEVLDNSLDGVVDGVQATLLVDLRGNRSSPIYLHYFGSVRPSDLKRPVLRGQVDGMRGWPTSLATSDNATLRQHGVTLTGLLTQADAAIQANDAAAQALKNFRVLGTRARLIDSFNAVRKSVYGSLGQIQHNNPQLGTGWAESFFRSGGVIGILLKPGARRASSYRAAWSGTSRRFLRPDGPVASLVPRRPTRSRPSRPRPPICQSE
jgi:hypothetical protein